MRQVSESLAGRASYLTLWPMTRREQRGDGRTGLWEELLSTQHEAWIELLQTAKEKAEDWRGLALRGGFPTPALHLKNGHERAIWFDGYVRTYLERDLQDLAAISALPDFRRLMRAASLRLGGLTNQTELGRDVSLPQATVHRWLNLLETSYLLVRLPAYAVNRTKRLIKSPKLFWGDTGVALHLSGQEQPDGSHLENLVLMDLLAWRDARLRRAELAYWRTTVGPGVAHLRRSGRALVACALSFALREAAARFFPVDARRQLLEYANMSRLGRAVLLAWVSVASQACLYPLFTSGGDVLNVAAIVAAASLGGGGVATPSCPCLTEGGAANSYVLTLQNQPSGEVTITVTPDAALTVNGTAGPIQVTVTPQNWAEPITITVNVIDDSVAQGTRTASITNVVTAGDPDFIGLDLGTAVFTITDDDTAQVAITESGGSTTVTEAGGSDVYDVYLTSQPLADVTVTITPSAQVRANGSATPIALVFTTTNYATPQSVTVTALNDAIAEGAHSGSLTHSGSSSDPGYNGLAGATVNASITDNDTAGISVTQTGGTTNISEAGTTDTYSVVLTSEPTAAVTVQVSFATTQVQANGSSSSPLSLNFTTGNWNVAQNVTVSAVNDQVAEGLHISSLTHTGSSTDANYNGLAGASVNANITDNDTAGITVTETGGSTDVAEGGATDTYSIVLTSEPTATVTVTVTPNAQVRANGSATPVALTFTTANWGTPQTVTVAAADDGSAEGAHTGSLSHTASSSDSNYNNFVIGSVTANITDNDVSIGGSVNGLSGGTLVLQNNGGDNLNVTSSGSFTFATALATGSAYSVTILSQPAGQLCSSPLNASGTASANVTNVQIRCVADPPTNGGSTGQADITNVSVNGGGTKVVVTAGTPSINLTFDYFVGMGCDGCAVPLVARLVGNPPPWDNQIGCQVTNNGGTPNTYSGTANLTIPVPATPGVYLLNTQSGNFFCSQNAPSGLLNVTNTNGLTVGILVVQ